MTASQMGRKGGKSRMASLSPAERTALARRGAESRWSATRRRVALATEAFTRLHARCFWYAPSQMKVTSRNLEFIAHGLRLYGGREGRALAERLGA